MNRKLRALALVSLMALVSLLASMHLAARGGFHPSFGLSYTEFTEMARSMPEPVTRAILNDPVGFLYDVERVLSRDERLLARVDRANGMSRDFVPDGLIHVSSHHPNVVVHAEDDRLIASAAHALSRMVRRAASDGVHLEIASAFRSYETQERLYEHYIYQHGFEHTSRLVAPPGHSEHQLGTTVDFAPVGRAFEGTPQDRWLQNHATRFGFSLSYPDGQEERTGYSYESWHYRYIGQSATNLLASYFDGIQHDLLLFFERYGSLLRESRY